MTKDFELTGPDLYTVNYTGWIRILRDIDRMREMRLYHHLDLWLNN